MAEKTVFQILSWCKHSLLPSLILGLLYLLLGSENLLLWSAFPLLGVVFLIKNQLLKIEYSKNRGTFT